MLGIWKNNTSVTILSKFALFATMDRIDFKYILQD